MDVSVTDPDPREARVLAAIVFTDVVGFSRLAARNEARVYVALQRDMAVMTNLCQAHSGHVLNTMGDGMLLYFSSAVDALGCAVEIQRTLYNQSLTLPSVEVLQHRIGVHLGDVIMKGDNVFGDGVNVAARLQTIAQPGGVCFSRTVHEVVKNKLKLDAVYVGPQQLKNIGEPVPVWQIAPLGRSRSPDSAADLVGAADPPEPATGARGLKAGLMVLSSLVLVGLLVFALIHLKAPSMRLSDYPGKAGGLAERIRARAGQDQGQAGQSTSNSTSDPAIDPGAQKQQTADRIAEYRRSYQFDEIVGLLNRRGEDVPEELAKIDTYRHLAALDSAVQQSVQTATASNPLPVPRIDGLPNSPLAAQVYILNSQIVVQTADGQSTMDWDELTPQQYLEIATAAVNTQGVQGSNPAQLAAYLQTFAGEYGVAIPQ